MTLRQPVVRGLQALCALAYLVLMAMTGAAPRQAQFVAFEAAGVMAAEPATVTQLTIAAADHTWTMTRVGRGWRVAAQALPNELATQIDLAVKFLHTARPVRTMKGAEIALADIEAFGLDTPVLTVTARPTQAPALVLDFGKPTIDAELQFMRVRGSPAVYLMSRFVGDEWLAVVKNLH